MRDRCEDAVRRFHALELANNQDPVIDYDCAPTAQSVEPYTDRFSALEDLSQLRLLAGDGPVADQLDAHIAYLSALLGQQFSLNEYVGRTQGCFARGWTHEYMAYRLEVAQDALETVGIKWDKHAKVRLNELDEQLPVETISDTINNYAGEYEKYIRSLANTSANFNLTVENVKVDEYWSYWLDGVGDTARLRINLNNASFTGRDAYRFALHEVLGHALQYASLSECAKRGDVPWPRLLAVHSTHQVLCEGLAQILPLVGRPNDAWINAIVRLDHYLQLVRAEIHVRINSGSTAAECWRLARSRAPMITAHDLEREFRDRSHNPRLRSYLWAYPAGLDWFMNLFEQRATLVPEVLRAAYQQPFNPSELSRFWPDGPTIGGNS